MYTTAKNISDLGITDYLNKPEVKELLKDYDTFNKHFEENCKGMYRFEPQWEIFALDSENTGVICVCRGKPMQHPGALHPIYPEVRQSWIDDIQYCIDRGVDGVNIRVSRHGGMNEPWAYGFNDPVIEKLKNKDDVYEAAVVNGKAFDAFMEDAADLLHKSGKEIGVHLCGFILCSADKKMATTKPSNFVWNWEKWVREIVDYTEFHKTNFFKFHNAREIIDHFGYVVTEAGKPFIYQSGQSGAVTHYEKPHRFLAFEMDWVKNHPHITCYNLYETASVFKINQNGVYEGSPHIRDLVKNNWE
jgi:glycosidase